MKYLYLITGFKVCSALAVAVAGGIESRTTPSTKCDLKNFLDNFDERVTLPASVAGSSAVGIEGALNYATFSVGGSDLTVLLPPPSKPHYAGTALLSQVTSGQQPQLTPANSTVQYFNFESLAYGCIANGSPAPISCTVQVIGTKGKAYGGGQVTQSLVFNPGPVVTGGLAKQFGTSTFPQPSWAGLVALTFSVISAPTGSLTNFLVDNVGYHACIGK